MAFSQRNETIRVEIELQRHLSCNGRQIDLSEESVQTRWWVYRPQARRYANSEGDGLVAGVAALQAGRLPNERENSVAAAATLPTVDQEPDTLVWRKGCGCNDATHRDPVEILQHPPFLMGYLFFSRQRHCPTSYLSCPNS